MVNLCGRILGLARGRARVPLKLIELICGENFLSKGSVLECKTSWMLCLFVRFDRKNYFEKMNQCILRSREILINFEV